MKGLSIFMMVILTVSAIPIIVYGDDLTADFTWEPQQPSTGELVHFTDNSTSQPMPIDWDWDFGDGFGSHLQNPTHTYSAPGNYLVILVVTWEVNGDFVVKKAQKVINVKNQHPVADAGPDQVVNSRTVTFDGSGSYDPDGEIASYKWDFGDGSTGEGKIIQHTYTQDGTFTAKLNVTDLFGAYDTDECVVTVDTVAPTTKVNITGDKGDNKWYISNVTVTLTATDATSGVDKIYYRVDNGSWQTFSTPFKISTEGVHVLEYYAKDKAGNNENVKNVTVKIDKSNPSLSIVVPQEDRIYIFGRDILPARRNPIIIGKITVSVEAEDKISGVEIVKFYVDDKEEYNKTAPPYEWRWGGEIGIRTLKVKVIDEAGLNAVKEMDVFMISLFKPREDAMIYGQ